MEALLDEDRYQTIKQLSDTLNVTEMAVSKLLHNLVLVWKAGNWLSHELSERQLEKRKTICELLFERCERKSFLHRIVTGDEKWVYYENLKRQKAWVLPGEPGPSTLKRNIHAQKVMLCIRWDQETITAVRYKQQLTKLNQALKKRHVSRNSHTASSPISQSSFWRKYVAWFWLPHRATFMDTSKLKNLKTW